MIFSRSISTAVSFALGLAAFAPLARASTNSVIPESGPFMAGPGNHWKKYRTNDQAGIMANPGDDEACFKTSGAVLPENVREMMFEHFRFYVENAKDEITEKDIAIFAKIAGIIPKESSGVTATVTDMHYRGQEESVRHFREDMRERNDDKNGARSSVETLEDLLKLKNVTWNEQTNFGLTQMSADRLISKDTREYATKLVENMKALYRRNPDDLIYRCGAPHVFNESILELRKEFGEIQSCKLGYSTPEEVKCFGSWAILCPAYNLTLGMLVWKNNPAYYQTRRATPICAKTFRKILRTGRSDGKGGSQGGSTKKSPTSSSGFGGLPVRPSGHGFGAYPSSIF